MKEIGIFKIDTKLCCNCSDDGDCLQKYSIDGECLYGNKKIKKQKIPETYEELKQILLDKYSNNKDYKIDTQHGDIYLDNIKRKNSFTITISYDEKEKVNIFDGEWLVTYNRTPEQALKIIENIMD
jgi:hypothetical protein